MEEPLFMYIEDGFCKLFGYKSNLVLLQFDAFFFTFSHEFIEIFFDILKHEVGLVDDSDDFFEFDDVGVVHFPQSFDFGELQTLLPSAIFLLQSLNRNNFFSFFVLGLFYIAEWPWA